MIEDRQSWRRGPNVHHMYLGATTANSGGRVNNSNSLPALITGDSSLRKSSTNSSSSSVGSSNGGSSCKGGRDAIQSGGYQLMGQNVASHIDESNITLRKQLDQEHKNRLLLENKVRETCLVEHKRKYLM
jgi:hypothetical protein